jgi:hypothetical protein
MKILSAPIMSLCGGACGVRSRACRVATRGAAQTSSITGGAELVHSPVT